MRVSDRPAEVKLKVEVEVEVPVKSLCRVVFRGLQGSISVTVLGLARLRYWGVVALELFG